MWLKDGWCSVSMRMPILSSIPSLIAMSSSLLLLSSLPFSSLLLCSKLTLCVFFHLFRFNLSRPLFSSLLSPPSLSPSLLRFPPSFYSLLSLLFLPLPPSLPPSLSGLGKQNIAGPVVVVAYYGTCYCTVLYCIIQ